MQVTKKTPLIMAIVLLGGCGSTDMLVKKQMETEGRLEQVLQASTEQKALIADLTREIQALEQKIAGLETGAGLLRNEMEGMREQLAVAATRPEQAAAPPATIQLVSAEPARIDSESSQQEAYMKAFGIFSANRYPEAITAFTAFIAAYPASEFAPNAQYWIGECHYSQKNYQQALDAFNEVLARYPKGKKAPDALLKVAFSQLSLNSHAAAKTTLQKLIETYPKSPAAAKAKERLNRL